MRSGDHPAKVSAEVDADGAWVLRVTGDLDLASAPELPGAVTDAGAPVPEGVAVIDLTDCTFVDSSGARAIVHVAAVLRERGLAVAIASPVRSTCRQVLELLGIDQVADLAADRPAALAAARCRRDDPDARRSDGSLAS